MRQALLTASRTARRPMLGWFALCVGLCLALRLPFIGAPLGIDEGGDAFIARAWSTTHGSMYGGYWLDRSPVLPLLYRLGLIGGDLGVRLLGAFAAVVVIAAVMVIARHVAGDRAARCAGIIAALLVSSVLLGAVFTGAEVLAAAPSALSITALIVARRSPLQLRWLGLAGVAASIAVLTKQSFLDALMAGFAFLLVSRIQSDRSGYRSAWLGAYAAGAAIPAIAVLGWAHLYSTGIRALLYAMWGFRLEALHVLARSDSSPGHLLVHSGLPIALASGMLFLLPWACAELWRLRCRGVLAATLGAWLATGVAGVTGGGNYFPHYFIELIPVMSVLAGCAIARRWRHRIAPITLGAIVVLALLNVGLGLWLARSAPPQQSTVAVAQFVRERARPTDSVYVMYARANVLYYTGLRSSYPFNWSLMVRALPQAQERLRVLLRSPRRAPVWVVEWQPSTAFGLDRDGRTRSLLRSRYRLYATVCDKHIYVRADRMPAGHDGAVTRDCRTGMSVPSDLAEMFRGVPASEADSVDYLWS